MFYRFLLPEFASFALIFKKLKFKQVSDDAVI